MKFNRIVFMLLLAAGLAPAQQLNWNYDKLAARASDSTSVVLDGAMLRMAGKFLSGDKDNDEAEVKKIVAGLKGIYVHSFEFKKAGEYSKEDLDTFRAQLHAPEWTRIVSSEDKEEGEDTEVYVKNEGDRIGGVAIIDAEPKELTLVNIVGSLDLESLSQLGGHFGVPEVDLDIDKKK